MLSKILKKNFNLVLLLLIIKIFSDSLYEFIEDDKLLVASYNKDFANQDELYSNEIQVKSEKFALIKRKIEPKKVLVKEKKEEIRRANFRNPDFFSDNLLDEENIGETLIPVNEKILFSGIPIPESKPYPHEKDISRVEVLTLKSEKELKKILDDRLKYFLNYNEIFQVISSDINYKAKNNLKMFYTRKESGNEFLSQFSVFKNKLFEVKSVINEHDKFVSQYIATPTERKITRFKIRVVNNINSSLQDLNIPKTIVKDFINQFSFSVDFQRDISDGDTIELLYEGDYLGNDELVGKPILLYASLDLKKNHGTQIKVFQSHVML